MSSHSNRIAIGRDEAIKNMGGMVWLYEKHLLKFQIAYADSAVTICEYLLRGQADDAQLLIHSIKGLAGTLGLRQLYYAAAVLEQAIKNSDPGISTYLSSYESCLMETLTTHRND